MERWTARAAVALLALLLGAASGGAKEPAIKLENLSCAKFQSEVPQNAVAVALYSHLIANYLRSAGLPRDEVQSVAEGSIVAKAVDRVGTYCQKHPDGSVMEAVTEFLLSRLKKSWLQKIE